MNKTIKSDGYIWDEILSGWKEMGRGVDCLLSGAKELEKAAELIRGHSDVNKLYLKSNTYNLNRLDNKVEAFKNHAKNIHRDLVYEIDRPFYKDMMMCVSDAYRINPRDFTLSKTQGDWKVDSIVLTDLLASTIEDIELRDDFLDMIENLDEDVPSESIQEYILESINEFYDYNYSEYMLNKDAGVIEAYKAARAVYIEYYEGLYPENAMNMDSLMMGLTNEASGKYQEDVENLKFMAYNAEEPYKTLFFEYLREMEIVDNNYTYVDPDDGNTYSSQFWSPGGNDLTLNFDPAYNNGISDPRGAYTTFFHEVGHGVDDLSLPEASQFLWMKQKDEKMVLEYRNENNQSLNDLMIEDVRERLTMEIKAVAELNSLVLSENQVDVLLDNMMVYNSPSEITDKTGAKDKILSFINDEVIDKMNNDLAGARIGGISDAYGGITNKTIEGTYAHGDDYWFNTDGSVRTYASTELYAHNFAYNMTGSTEQQEYMAKYFPRANALMEQMANELSMEIEEGK